MLAFYCTIFLIIIIIICHDLRPPSRRTRHVKSDHARPIIPHVHAPLSPYTGHLRFDISTFAIFTYVMASHPPLVIYNSPSYRPERGRAVLKNTGTKQKWQRATQSSTCVPVLSLFPISHHQSNLPSVYPIPAVKLLLPVTPF